jgi:6-pyruvoyltetrahydropterin/6-carboxytetrahydropterin synthase
MKEQYAIEVSGIGFAAAHFVSEGGKCECLHGHNYQVTVSVQGQLNSQGMVLDFRVLKQLLRELCQDWDHRVLLPTQSKLIKIERQDVQIQVKTPGGTYSFPASDVVLLDVLETTAEEMANILCQRLSETLKLQFPNITKLSVTLAESPTSQALVSLAW